MNEEINPENLNDIIEKVCQESREALFDDPEWTTKKWFHIKTLIEAISVGIISADPYHFGYYLPKNYEKVMNYYIENIENIFNKQECIEICLIKIEGLNKKILMKCPEFVEWNNIESPENARFIDRYTPTYNNKQFMDLDAVLRNASVYLRDYIRKTEAFDKKFEEEWKKSNPEQDSNE
jgi:hypothetical protein